jgi:hypothetical protein
LHRRSTIGDRLALAFFEDLYAVRRSPKLAARIEQRISVTNTRNARQGILARRGDGSFGEIVPRVEATVEQDYLVHLDRVCSDLRGQADHFKSHGGNAISVGIVGVNEAAFTVGYEGERVFRTNERNHKHPKDEAPEARRRLIERVGPPFDELLVLNFTATNEAPYSFAWANERQANLDLGATLVRVSQAYERRF